jgi:hypothetical protein
MRKIDLDFVRAQFPALAVPSLERQAFFEKRRRLVPVPARHRTLARVIAPPEGSALLSLSRVDRGR